MYRLRFTHIIINNILTAIQTILKCLDNINLKGNMDTMLMNFKRELCLLLNMVYISVHRHIFNS